MSHIEDKVRVDNAAWWAAHPDFRERYRLESGPNTANSLARSVVHWHHNVETAKRYGNTSVEGELLFLRLYAISATRAALLETQTKLDALPPWPPADGAVLVPPAHDEHWYGRRDLECEVRTLQHALDTFEWNDQHRKGT